MYQSIFTSVATVAMLSLTGEAAPLTERSTLCPTGTVYFAPQECSSGFVGCANPSWRSDICPGPRRFWNDCGNSNIRNLGFWFVCESNGFKGCTTDIRICDGKRTGSIPSSASHSTPSKAPEPHHHHGGAPPAPSASSVSPPPSASPVPPTQKWSCPPGTNYFGEGVCPSGFIGCHAFGGEVCPGAKRFNPGECPAGTGSFFRCSNGFVGCTTNVNICDPASPSAPSSAPSAPSSKPSSKPSSSPSASSSVPSAPSSKPSSAPSASPVPPTQKWSCPPGTNYFGEGVCPSGFVGCHSFGGEVCPGAKRFNPGECPVGTGSFFRCSNGFVGCTTNVNICG